MGTEPLTIGGWRTLVEAGVCDAAGALALRAALEAADQAVADRKLRRDGLDDVLQAALLVLCDTRAIECEDDVPLSEWFAGILPRLAQRERRAAARTTGRLLCEAEIASLAFRTFDRDDGESESPAEGSKPPFPPVTDAEQRAGEALAETESLAAAARRLGISVGALRSRLAHARRRNPARPPPQAPDRSWARDEAAWSERSGAPGDAELLRDYASGLAFDELARRHGTSANALRQKILRRHARWLKRVAVP